MPYFGVRMPYFLPLIVRDFYICHTDPHCMAYFGGMFLGKYGGWGWSELLSNAAHIKAGRLDVKLGGS